MVSRLQALQCYVIYCIRLDIFFYDFSPSPLCYNDHSANPWLYNLLKMSNKNAIWAFHYVWNIKKKNAPGSIAFSQEHFKTISYAKFGGQTECIMGNWKIVNRDAKKLPKKC